MKKLRKKSGFTLVELVISLVIFGIIVVAATAFLDFSSKAGNKTAEYAHSQQSLMATMKTVKYELNGSKVVVIAESKDAFLSWYNTLPPEVQEQFYATNVPDGETSPPATVAIYADGKNLKTAEFTGGSFTGEQTRVAGTAFEAFNLSFSCVSPKASKGRSGGTVTVSASGTSTQAPKVGFNEDMLVQGGGLSGNDPDETPLKFSGDSIAYASGAYYAGDSSDYDSGEAEKTTAEGSFLLVVPAEAFAPPAAV
ncbi:MAG: type II secretion system GspH family protein [Clostridiales bacterium]|nr:type II secretion system GspH family protein [Clostridiales bacterium]